ncbi:hypothetical protein RHMOL_Rhmol01G0126600 [Rhododendron molle]|nr:hypothetical protein RHMOL_Rhmol01G0126600 [Rhododendron molle]
MQRWRTCLERISNPIQSHDIPLSTSSCGASQVAQPNTTSHIAQPQTTSQVQLPRGFVRRTRSNASHAPSQNSSQPQDEDVDEDLIPECEVGIAGGLRGVWYLGLAFAMLVLLVSVLSKFAIPENDSAKEAIKKKTLKLLGTRLRDWRCTLKSKYFDETKTVAQIVATAPPTVNREHFADLVRYWFSEEGKEVDSGFAPSRAQLYIPTHTKADGKPVNDIAGENMEAIKGLMESQPNGWEGNSKGSIFWAQDDIYSQVIPTKKWHGRVPGCGFGPTPKSSGSTCSNSPRFIVADEEERMRDKETIHKLEDKVHAQAVEISTLKEQVAEMSTLKEQVAFMMRHMPELTGLQVRNGCNGPSDQASPHAHQRSSHASHDIECSNGVSAAVNVMGSNAITVQFLPLLLVSVRSVSAAINAITVQFRSYVMELIIGPSSSERDFNPSF